VNQEHGPQQLYESARATFDQHEEGSCKRGELYLESAGRARHALRARTDRRLAWSEPSRIAASCGRQAELRSTPVPARVRPPEPKTRASEAQPEPACREAAIAVGL